MAETMKQRWQRRVTDAIDDRAQLTTRLMNAEYTVEVLRLGMKEKDALIDFYSRMSSQEVRP